VGGALWDSSVGGALWISGIAQWYTEISSVLSTSDLVTGDGAGFTCVSFSERSTE